MLVIVLTKHRILRACQKLLKLLDFSLDFVLKDLCDLGSSHFFSLAQFPFLKHSHNAAYTIYTKEMSRGFNQLIGIPALKRPAKWYCYVNSFL
jgi:hypothetical protein